jgi:hypothetical protein
VLKSDFLLVQTPGGSSWRSFRDIFAVDGQPVRDRQERLTKLFLEGSSGGIDLARAVAEEGARYNIGDPDRSINNPLLALGYLQTIYQPRFRFSLGQPDPTLGPDVWIVEYKERTRPTMLRLKPDADLVSSGRMWIEAKTGRVRRTELTVLDSDEITTSFRFDDGLQMDVPYEMRESYWFGGYLVTGTATYGSFRRFQVSTEEKIR